MCSDVLHTHKVTDLIYTYVRSHSVCDLCTGCVTPDESSEEWLLKNFGAFRVQARLRDFSALNMVFSGVSLRFYQTYSCFYFVYGVLKGHFRELHHRKCCFSTPVLLLLVSLLTTAGGSRLAVSGTKGRVADEA